MSYAREEEMDRQQQVLLRSHLERCLQDIWGVGELVMDEDRDYPYRNGTAACWVSLIEGPAPAVRVFAHAAGGLRSSAKLLAEINEINTRSRWARVFHQGGVVTVSTDLHWAAVERLALAQVLDAVGEVAADIGGLVAGVFGGSTPFPPELADQDQDTTEEAA